jgi:hypothetical protein
VSRDPRTTPIGAAAQQSWPVRVHRLGSEPGDDLSAATTSQERFATMWPLALEAFTVDPAELQALGERPAP